MYISYIAILKAGLAFCPIAHDTPKERLQALFEDLQPITVLVAGSAPSAASAMSAKPLLDTTPYLRACDVSTSCSLEKGTPTIPSTSTAYVLYTSGTTGRAKGVAISHASAACTISALSSHYGFGQLLGPTNTQQLRWFQGAAPTFDISIFEIFWTLSTGSTLCCAPRDFTLQNLDKVLTTLKADITNITPSFASLLDPSSIKGLMLGGESLTTRIIQDFAPYNAAAISRSVGKPSGLYNGYGPTEAAIYCIAQAHVPSGQRGSVIGTPLSTCGVLIVDEGYTEAASTLTLRPVPMGATGELVLIGPQISQTGYINRESETAAAFFDDDTWGRGYKSGDRARIVWDDRGNPIIEFLGRISDDQVKLSGRRVELAEIESILTEKVPQIRETLSVVWRPQGSVSGSEKVVSLIVLDPDSRDDFGSVERDCMRVAHQYLPDYMRPFRLLNVEELPKSSSGKKNRAKAAEHVQVHLEQHNYPTSRDVDIGRLSPLSNEGDAKLEDELLEMVSNILGTNQTINATTLLASTGLDSLLAMRFLRDIRHRWSRSDLGQEYPRYSQLQPSLAQLLGADASIRSVFFSAFAEGKREQARLRVAEFSRKNMPEALSKLNVTPRDVEAILPATNTQSQLAVSFAMDARNYISHSILRLRAGTCVPALMHSIESVISLQPIYRSMMIPCGDSFSPFAQVVVTQDAWSQITEASPRITHQKVCAQYLDSGIDDLVENAAAKMNLESNILYQIQVIEEDQDIASPVVLILSFAHCICDGASIQLLLLDIASCFSGQTLPQRNSIFDSVVDWASGLDPATDRMWQDELVGQEAESLGSLSGNNAEFGQSKEKKDFGMVQHQSELSWAYLESRSRILNSSPLSIVQAAWCVLISLLSEADTLDVTFGSVLSGHHTPTHAPDFSVVPCRVALPSSQTVQELLEALNAKSRVAQTKRHTSFGVLRALPYNTALALQAYTDSDEKREPEVASFPWTEARSRAIRYDFAIFAEVIPPSGGLPGSPEYFGDGMTFKITYHEDTLSKVSAGFVARQLAGLVDVFLGADPYDLVQALPSRLPRHLLSVEGNATDQSHSAESHATLLHSQFESQAAATPDRVALTFYTSLDTPPTDVSYRELDSRANGLANILRQENAEVIPICIQRSVDLYVAILAILKAGSAWCPIDDTSPIQRRTSLIARTQSNVLLTNKESLHLVEPCLSQESLHGWRVIIMDEYANHELLVRPNPRTGTLSPGSICGTDLAYLLWTSGTTGEPKGVMIPHSAAFQAMKDLQIQVAHDDKAGQVRTLQLSSYTFDVFVQDLFYTWGLAGCVVSGTRELILGTFVDFIWKARPTHAHLTPSFGASIAVEEIRGSTLQYVTFIGEKLTEDVAHAWAAPDITTAAYNTYGPAENAVVSTMRQFRGKTREPAKAANVGFPLNSCTAFVVREVEMAHGQQKRWELVPRYGVGELALGGLQVGKGYLANKTKTTKSFITNANAIDGRIYLTGDMVRLNDHGFEFLGRNDDLVKITGIRIELSEISAACATVKSEEAAIEHVETLYLPLHGSDAESKSKVVVTFVSIKTSDIDTDSIRSQVIQRAKDLLPAYMVPGHVIILDGSMPRTASNKVDRKVLREIYQSSDLKLSARGVLADPSGGVDASKTEHWSEEELPIVDMITAYLEIPPERNSPDNTLAALGLSSLQITKLAWYLKRELECPINVLSLMRCQILGELINVVTDAMFKEQDMALSLNVEHPLALNIFEAEKTIELTGDGRQISQGQLDLMLQQTLEVMHAMVDSPDTALCQLRNRFARNLVSVSGKTLSASPQQVDPSDTVAIHASNSPDWIAAEELVFEESDALDDTILTRQITYGQLNTLTNAIATKLTTHAAQLHTDDVVAMYMARDIMSLAVTLAIFRAGFVYLPIDEDLPLARKQLIIRDAKAKLVITTADLENTLGLDRNDDPPVFLVPDGNDAIDTVSSWPRSWTREPIINGGYLLYTSGSSGRPKGVRVSAQNLCSFIEAFSTRLVEHAPATATLGNSGKYLNLTSRAFDPHLTQMFVPWYLGYRVVIGKDRNSMLASLHQVIKHSEITHFGSVPSVLTKMGLKHSDVPTVRVITTGGEQASSELLDMWSSPAGPTAADDHGRATLFNFYGPTEVTIGCLGHAVNHNSNSRNLGLPLHGLEALLICHTSEGDAVLAMRGQPGELCIAGPQVAIGYLDRPDETAKSFCTIHLPNWGEKRVYRTGDMMRMMHDGTLEFLGRIDQQTKVRGQRLELGEVVTFLKESSVGEGHLDFAAAVVSNPNANNQQVLMGFVARDARDLLRRELEADSQVVHNLPQAQQDLFNVIGQKCDEKLPAFMVPTLVWVSKIPYLAASGKVDAKQLKRLGNDFFGGQTHTIHQYHCDAPQGSMPFVPSEMVQRWVGSDRKLFDSLLSINIIDNDVAVTPENKPGGMAALHTESKSDMALAIDVDIYTDGSIDLTLSSCGVLSSSRLADTAQIFEKIVCSAATAGATVGQFVPVYHHTSTLARISDPKAEGSKSTLSDRGQLSATDSVHIALSRFLQLPKPEISTKPGTTTLYQLGLDSITVLPFVKCLSGETGLKLTVDAVIKSRTVQGLIDHVHGSEAKLGKRLTSTELEAVESVHKPSQKEDTVSDSYDNILAELAKDLFFLATPMQEGMLSASFAITKSAYLYSHSIQLSGKALEMDTPSLDAFSAAVQDVIQACEILRTQFTFTQNSQAPWLARDGPVFDEYPLIANFFISGNTLYGKLRGNLGSSELKALGRAVEAMLMRIAVGDAHEPVIDLAKMKITTRHDSKKNGALSSKTDRVGELNGHTPHCDAVLDIVKAILGPRSKGRALDYYTKLANAGIDSILAIKLANAVRKKTGLIVSVFQIMKGASVRDIVENGTRDQREEPHASTQKSQSQAKEQEMKSLVAEKLQSSEDLILSVLPVLSGQRAHLEQWLLHGKRFFEAPWLYRVLDDNIDKEMVARRWSELVRAHDILRTTFAVVGKDADLVQVTLSEADNGSSRFTVIHDDGKLIEELVTQHISKENADPSNMRKPPSRLSFLEGSDGKAVVLRFHHALYDAWSIKMIESDLINMLTHGTALQHHGSLELQVQQIRGARDLAMENSYWRQHLLRAQDTILLPAEDSQLAVQVSHGPHFKVKSSVGIPREAVDCLASTKNPSAVILFAFAKTLSRFTGRSHPTFGLSHASRVLCSTTGAQDIDLTAANMPTLTVTPMSVDLERGANAPASALTSIQHHLAQLAKFSQTGNVRKMGPRFNTHINIMFVDSDQAVQVEERPNKTKALSRWRLGEPIASDYFTISKPSTLSASLVDQLDISHLYPHQLFFNITVQDQQSISVSLSGDRSLLAGSMMSAEAFIACFTTQLEESTQQAFE
ncbi:amino acid adenylation domain-containing protein [Cordyceps javanica]|nr:amino acid adenylation domain-containing protein [Cordyceps javanica]